MSRRWLLLLTGAVLIIGRPARAADGGTPEPPTAEAFAGYYGFSSDSLLFAYTERTPTGLRLRWLSTTTSTVERVSELDTPAQRQEAMADLQEEGFPALGAKCKVPPTIATEIRKGAVVIRYGGMPSPHSFKPFRSYIGVSIDDAKVVAVSPDRKLVAVRVTGHTVEKGTVPPEFRVVPLFE